MATNEFGDEIEEQGQVNEFGDPIEDAGGIATAEVSRGLSQGAFDVFFSDKPIEELLPTEQSEIAGSILDSFEDPTRARNQIINTFLLSELFGVPHEQIQGLESNILKQMFGDPLTSLRDTFQKKPVEGGFFSKMGEAFKRGNEAISSDIAVYDSVFGGQGNIDNILEIRRKQQLGELLSPIEGNVVSDLFYKSAQIAPGMARGFWDAVPEAFAGMLAGAGVAAIAGQAGPQIVLPEEVITVPVAAAGGASLGLKAGATMFWYKQGAGSMIATMLENDYDPEISSNVAGIAAIPYALIELSQVSKLTPGLRQGINKAIQKTTLKIFGAAVKKYGTTLTGEILEEVAQEIITVAAEDIAGILSKEDIPFDAEYIRSRSNRLWQTAKESTKAMALLPLPGVGIDVFTGIRAKMTVSELNKISKQLLPVVAKRENAIINKAIGTQQFESEGQAKQFSEDIADMAENQKRDIKIDITPDNEVTVTPITEPTPTDIAPKAAEAKPEAVDDFARGAKVRAELLEKARKFDEQQGFTIEDVTPEGFGPEIREGEESVPRRPSLAFSTEQQLIRTEINEAKTLLKGDISGDKRAAVEKRLKKAEDEFLSSLTKEQTDILESQKLEQLPTPTAKPKTVAEIFQEPTLTERIIEGPPTDTTNRDLLAERKSIQNIPANKRDPKQIERINEIEDELVIRNADKFPDIDISPKTRNAEIKKVREQILADPIFQIQAEAAEDLPDLSGSFNVDSKEIGDVKQRFEGRPELLKKFDLVETGGRRWDSAADEFELGIDKLDEFMDIVELFVESKKPGAINPAALADALADVEGTQQGTSLEIFALKEEMLTSGFTAAETNDAIVKHIKEENLNPEDFKDDLIPLEEITDVETKRRILKALEKTTPKVKVRRTTDPEKIAIAKAQTRATKLKTPIFITETKFGVFATSINQPSSGDFIVVAPAEKGQLVGKVERVTDGKEGLTRAEIRAIGPSKAVELIKEQARGEPVGFKAGQAESREKAKVEAQKIKAAEKLSDARRKTAADLVRAFTEKEDQGKFLLRVAQAKTPKDLAKIMTAVEKGIARAEKIESINNLKAAAKAISPKRMLPEFAGVAQTILDSLQIGKLKPETVIKNADMKAMAQQVLDTAREDSVAAFQALQLLNELREKQGKTFAINQLSLDAIDQITDTLIALRFQNEADTIAAKDENATEAIRRRTEIKGSIVEKPEVPESIGGKSVKKFKLLHDNLESALDAVAGARPGTYDLWIQSKRATTQYIYDVLNNGVDNQIRHNEKARDIFRQILIDNGISSSDILNWSARPEDISLVRKATGTAPTPIVHTFTLSDTQGNKTKFSFTVNEVMSIFMDARNSHNLSVLLNDGLDRVIDGKKQKVRGLTVETIDDMIDVLTPQQKKIARQVGSRLMDGFNKDGINKTSVTLEFFELAKVSNYWPARRSIIRTPKGKQIAGAVKTVEGMGLLKERVGVGNPMKLSGFFETVYNTNKNVATYIGLAEPLREVKSVYNTDIIDAMENAGRGDEAKVITDLIVRFEDQSTLAGPLDTIIKKMLGGFAKSKLFLNLKIAPRQQISSFLISAYVDGKYIAEFKGVANKDIIAEIGELSPQTKARFEGLQFDRDVGDSFLENEMMNYMTGETSLIDKTALGMKFFDTNAIVDLYRATKAEVTDKGIDINTSEGKIALKDRFEWVMRHTQPMWHPKDRSLLGSDPRPLVRSLTMFMSQREQLVRMVNNGISDFVNSDKTTEDVTRLGRTLSAVALNLVAFTLYNFAWSVLVHKKKRDVWDLGKAFIKDIISLPFFGKYIAKSFDIVFNILTDKPVFSQAFDEGPIEGILREILLEAIPNFTRAGVHFVNKEKYKSGPNKGQEKWETELFVAVDALASAIASLKGVPYYGAKDIVRSINAQLTDNEKKAPSIK